jgi:hypothetical protein
MLVGISCAQLVKDGKTYGVEENYHIDSAQMIVRGAI